MQPEVSERWPRWCRRRRGRWLEGGDGAWCAPEISVAANMIQGGGSVHHLNLFSQRSDWSHERSGRGAPSALRQPADVSYPELTSPQHPGARIRRTVRRSPRLAPAPVPKPIHILLADDHWVVRAGLHALLDREANLRVVGEAATGEEAVKQTRALKPDVVLMDLVMPGIGGLEAVRPIPPLHPRPNILFLIALLQYERLQQYRPACLTLPRHLSPWVCSASGAAARTFKSQSPWRAVGLFLTAVRLFSPTLSDDSSRQTAALLVATLSLPMLSRDITKEGIMKRII